MDGWIPLLRGHLTSRCCCLEGRAGVIYWHIAAGVELEIVTDKCSFGVVLEILIVRG